MPSLETGALLGVAEVELVDEFSESPLPVELEYLFHRSSITLPTDIEEKFDGCVAATIPEAGIQHRLGSCSTPAGRPWRRHRYSARMTEDSRAHANDPFSQAKYQVRFDQGAAAASRIAGSADIAVWVDALARVSTGGDASGVDVDGAPRDFLDALPTECAVVASALVDAHAVASWILAEQERLGRR